MSEQDTDHDGTLTVLLEPANPFDLSEDDLEALAQRIRGALPAADVGIAYDDQLGAGGPWYQVLHLWVAVTFAETIGYGTLVDLCKDWLREQFHTVHGHKRSKTLVVHELESGREILSVQLRTEADEFEVEVLNTFPRKRPKGRHCRRD